MWFDKDIVNKLDKISDLQIEHTVQLRHNTDILNEHHVRASNLEARIKPIENHVLIINSIVKILIVGAGAASAIIGAISYFK